MVDRSRFREGASAVEALLHGARFSVSCFRIFWESANCVRSVYSLGTVHFALISGSLLSSRLSFLLSRLVARFNGVTRFSQWTQWSHWIATAVTDLQRCILEPPKELVKFLISFRQNIPIDPSIRSVLA